MDRDADRLLAWMDRAERFAARLWTALPPRLAPRVYRLRDAHRLGVRLSRWQRRGEREGR